MMINTPIKPIKIAIQVLRETCSLKIIADNATTKITELFLESRWIISIVCVFLSEMCMNNLTVCVF